MSITVNITNEFMEAYCSTIKNGVEYVNLIFRNGSATFYCECKDVFYMAIVPAKFSEDISLRLPVKTTSIIFRCGKIDIDITDKLLNITHTDTNDKITAVVTVAHGYCNLESHIINMLRNSAQNSITITDTGIFKRALRLARVTDVKGVQFNKGYAYAMSNGYLAYMRDQIGLTLSISNYALRSLVNFIGNNNQCCISNYNGYNLCNVGFTVFGWRRARPTECYDLSMIEYDYSTTLTTDLFKFLFSTFKNDMSSVTLDFSTGILECISTTGKYSLQTDIEITKFEGSSIFKLNPNVLKDIVSNFAERVDLKVISSSTLAIVSDGIFYSIGGVQ